MKNKINSLNIIKISISILNKREKLKLIFLSILALISSFFDFVSIFSVYPFINIIFEKEVIFNNKNFNAVYNFLGSPDLNLFIIYLSLIIISLIITASLLNFYNQYLSNMFAAECQTRMGKELFEKFIYIDYEWHIERNSIKLMNLFTIHLFKWSRSIIRQIPLLLGYLTTILVPVISLIILSPRYSLIILLSFSFIIFYFLKVIRKKTNTLTKILRNKLDVVNILLVESIQGIKDVKLSSSEKNFTIKFDQIYNDFCKKTSIIDNFNQVPVNTVLMVSQLSIVSLGAILFISNISTSNLVGIMSVVALVGFKIIPSINKFGNAINSISNAFIFAEVVDDTLKALNAKVIKDKFARSVAYESFKWKKVTLRNIKYQYPDSANLALNGINLEIKRGLHYGFVGYTGSGKSTTIDIFNGLLSPSQGNVLLDKIFLEEFGIRRWQSKIGYVPQQPKISDLSILENIAFGSDYPDIDKDRVNTCIEIVGLKDFVRNLPQGLETLLGDRGKFLSGGQQQLIAIARALYKRPEILILDEATSSLDAVSESLVRETFQRLHGKTTLLTIAHQFSNIKDADHIFVFEKGKIVDQGNYSYLRDNSKIFNKFLEKN